MPRLRDILPAMQQQRVRRIAVPAGTSDLLVPSLWTIRHVQMRDEPHIRSIDPHAEGDRRHDHDRFARAEPGQRRAFVLGLEPGMECHRRPALVTQPCRDALRLGA